MRAPDFWAAAPDAALDKFLAAALSPLGNIYGAVTTARANRKPLWQAPVPVICVGNAVMGGAGKTQVCLDLARRLSDGNRAVHVLSRGYGGRLAGPVRVDAAFHRAGDVGDEALVLARHAPTWVGAERTQTARAATDAGAGLLIMDDGFQNPALHKDLNLLVIDGGYGFGNGRVCPAGPLRERAESAFARSDAVCIIGTPGPAVPAIPEDLPVFQARIMPDPRMASVKGKKVIAFAGIGRPEKFFDTLLEAGAEIRKTLGYPDHYQFLDRELDFLLQSAEDSGAEVVTTEKDHARLSDAYKSRIVPFPVQLEWEDAPALENFLLERIGLN
ncbi:tetraacyldisaccharide 4'-kinase [Thalassospiraceae bacterium LMO-JJ14]|nr:tetraacyldisaccharide 4'-kinase [Thalassospiraceae bacterium LMO-JJ14]